MVKNRLFSLLCLLYKNLLFSGVELVPIEPAKDDEINEKDIYKIYKKLIENIHKDFLQTIENIHEVKKYGINYFQFDEKMV